MSFSGGSALDEVRAGTQLGRYEILLPIAQGGMARVWAARQHGQRGFSKVVAIKTILPQLARDPSFEAMFLDEAHLASGVHHPNVCEIFDLGEEQDTLYIAMEWVNGEALSRVLKPPVPKGQKAVAYPLDPRTSARIVADAAKGLHAAHELKDDSGQPLGLVHRDVSPQNILISIDGVVKVTDFGVAKALRTQHEATSAGQVKGKVAYMAPEHARGGHVDRRSDVFALGIVLYEITTGARPFGGQGEIEVMKALAAGRFEPPSALVGGYPPELEGIVLVALSMDPAERFPSADSMRLALEEWLARSGPVVTEAQVAETVRSRIGRQIEERVAKIRDRTRAPGPEPSSPVNDVPFTPVPSEASSSHAALQGISSISHASAPSVVSTVGPASAPSNISQFSPVVQTAPPPASLPQGAGGGAAAKTALLGVAAGVAVFALVAVGGGGYYIMRGKSKAEAAPILEPAPAASSATPAAAEFRVQLVEPKTGVTLLVDGVVQPVGRLSFTRPAAGSVRLLTARADGYKDEVLRIDDAAEVVDVLLQKDDAGEPKQEPGAVQEKPDKGGEPKAGSSGEKPAAEKPKPKPVKPDIPDNPF